MAKMLRAGMTVLLLVTTSFAGWIAIKGLQPVGVLGADLNGESADLADVCYWDYMADRLQASSQTPANCYRTRLIFLAIALPVYPALYTTVALFPQSYLTGHVQQDPLIPDPISLRQAPDTWWRLVVEVSWLAFTQPQWDFTPGVWKKIVIDQRCNIPLSSDK